MNSMMTPIKTKLIELGIDDLPWVFGDDEEFAKMSFWNSMANLRIENEAASLWTYRSDTFSDSWTPDQEEFWIAIRMIRGARGLGPKQDGNPKPLEPLSRKLEKLIGNCKMKYGDIVRKELEAYSQEAKAMEIALSERIAGTEAKEDSSATPKPPIQNEAIRSDSMENQRLCEKLVEQGEKYDRIIGRKDRRIGEALERLREMPCDRDQVEPVDEVCEVLEAALEGVE